MYLTAIVTSLTDRFFVDHNKELSISFISDICAAITS